VSESTSPEKAPARKDRCSKIAPNWEFYFSGGILVAQALACGGSDASPQNPQAEQAVEEVDYFVILSGAKNLS